MKSSTENTNKWFEGAQGYCNAFVRRRKAQGPSVNRQVKLNLQASKNEIWKVAPRIIQYSQRIDFIYDAWTMVNGPIDI